MNVYSNTFAITLANSLRYQTALTKPSRTDENQMIDTFKKLAEVTYLIFSVSKVFGFYNCSKFKRVFHITTFFVTTFFVAVANVQSIGDILEQKDGFFVEERFR